jgi:GNAT superfamily N-acetyltransferase
MASEWEGEPAYQLRGMATAPGWQRRGLGKNLLVYSENSIADLGVGSIIWCNARLGALDFYLRQGWTRASEVFEIPGVGPHYRLSKTLAKKPLADATS